MNYECRADHSVCPFFRPTPNNRNSFVPINRQSSQAELLFRSAPKGREYILVGASFMGALFWGGTDCAENTGAAAFCSKNKNRGIPCVLCIPCQKIVICVNPCNL